MSSELKIIRDETVEIIESQAVYRDIPAGEQALELLQNKNVKGLVRDAALFVRAREIVQKEKDSRWPTKSTK